MIDDDDGPPSFSTYKGLGNVASSSRPPRASSAHLPSKKDRSQHRSMDSDAPDQQDRRDKRLLVHDVMCDDLVCLQPFETAAAGSSCKGKASASSALVVTASTGELLISLAGSFEKACATSTRLTWFAAKSSLVLAMWLFAFRPLPKPRRLDASSLGVHANIMHELRPTTSVPRLRPRQLNGGQSKPLVPRPGRILC